MTEAVSAERSEDTYLCDQPASYVGIVAKPYFSAMIAPYRQFLSAARKFPNKDALVHEKGRLTFLELSAMIDRYASGLRNGGLQVGEGVAAAVGNRWEQLPLFLAVAKLGGIYMAASRWLTRAELDYQLAAFRPRFLVGDGGISIEGIEAASTDEPIEPFADEHAGLSLRFSSGTTGKPKMMLASQRQQAALYPTVAAELGLQADDRHLVVGPLAHMAMHMALAQMFVGGTIFMREAFDKEGFWEDCRVNGITNTAVVPTMIASALEFPGDAPQLRAMLSMGAPLAVGLKNRLLDRFPNLGLYEMYGASELGMGTCLHPADQLRKPTSVGQPVRGQDVGIFDDEGNPCAPGVVGTIYVRGQFNMIDYVGDVRPAPPPAHLADAGWLQCGDLGYLDEEGFLYISDRRSDLILSGGLNVYPAEVEAVLATCDNVGNTVVIGTPDERWGMRVTAYIEGHFDEAAVLATCREKLASYKIPRALFAVDQLPRTSTGKISRTMVRDAVERGELPC